MGDQKPLPAFRFRDGSPSLWTLLRHGIADVGSVIPSAILEEFAVALPGPGAPLVVSHPDLAREILNDRVDAFGRDRFIKRLFRRSWGQGLAAAEGAQWRSQRAAAAPFFRPQAVARLVECFGRAADEAADGLATDGPVDLNVLAGRIIARIVFSSLVAARGEVDPDAAAADVPPYIRRIAGFALPDLLPLPERVIDWIAGIDRDLAVRRLRQLAAHLAATRPAGPRRDDMIALLEGVGPIEDNIRGLFPAAMDTTVAGLGWALFVLAQCPEWQERIAGEARAAGPSPSLDSLPLTRRVVQEVLRLYPPAPLLARSAAHDQVIAGHKVRRGQSVIIAVYAMHRHPRLWERPDCFDPDRFLSERASAMAYMPFGIGPRMCIAAQFALAELTVVLARLVARLAWRPAGAEPEVSLKVTTRSRNGLHARMEQRG